MNPFLLPPSERLGDWKAFRTHLSDMPESAQLQAVAQYWGQAPLVVRGHEVDDIEKWPGPWEMIVEDNWSRDTVAVGMEFTLRLSGWDSTRLELLQMRDYDISEEMLILKIDNRHVLNYCIGQVEEYPNTRHDILSKYQFKVRGYSPL